MNIKPGEIFITNSPSRRKVLAILDSLVFFSKPNRFDTPDPQPYTEEMIKQKGWKRENGYEKSFFSGMQTLKDNQNRIPCPDGKDGCLVLHYGPCRKTNDF